MKKIVTGIIAHVDAGKTTLSEAMLYNSKVIRNLGRVDHKNAYLDTFEQEKARGITIYSKEARINHKDCSIVLLDTPGHVDFSSEMERALLAMDVAILVVSVNEGVQGHTRTLMKLLDRYELPAFVFVNKMDQAGADKDVIMEQLCEAFGDRFVDFSCIQQHYEDIALNDEQVLEKYLETGSVDDEDISVMIRDRKVIPVYFGAALKNLGVESFMDGINAYASGKEYSKEFGARVYKISRDEKGSVLTHLKITGDSLKVKTLLDMGEGEDSEKVDQIRLYSGAKYEVVPEVFAGDVCTVTGLSKSYVGQCFGSAVKGKAPLLTPIFTYKMTITSGEDPAAIMIKLKQLEQEEPGLHIRWNKELREIHIQLMGEIQTQILKDHIKARFGVDVEFDQGSIVYRETIADNVSGVGHFEPLRHYAEVQLMLEPGEKGSGITIATDCSEDILAKNWQRLIVTHLNEKEHKGVLTGAPITDVKITLTGGRAHTKHTEGGDFRQATYRAVRQGLMEAKSVLLEPFYDFELKIPAANVGRAMSDVEIMCGSVNISENDGQMATLNGYAPAVCIRDYHIQVVAYTKGQGNLQLMFRGYEPCHNADEVILAKRYDPEADIRNTPDSVFCAHGAGFVVPWNQVKSYMHTTLNGVDDVSFETADTVDNLDASRTVKEYTGSYAEDKELEKIFYQTFGKKDDSGKKDIFRKHSSDVAAEPAKRVPMHLRNKPRKEKYLLVDGYNILFAWDELNELSKVNVDGARSKLMDIMCNYQGYAGCNLIVVFDAYKVKGHACESVKYNNITVVYTAHAQTADSYIEQFAHDMAGKYDITVATSDRLEQMIILGEGAVRLSAKDFYAEVMRVEQAISDKINI